MLLENVPGHDPQYPQYPQSSIPQSSIMVTVLSIFACLGHSSGAGPAGCLPPQRVQLEQEQQALQQVCARLLAHSIRRAASCNLSSLSLQASCTPAKHHRSALPQHYSALSAGAATSAAAAAGAATSAVAAAAAGSAAAAGAAGAAASAGAGAEGAAAAGAGAADLAASFSLAAFLRAAAAASCAASSSDSVSFLMLKRASSCSLKYKKCT